MKHSHILCFVLSLLILALNGIATQAQNDRKVYWGRVVNGVQAGARLEDSRDSYLQGDRVAIKILLRNVTKKPVTFETTGFVDTPFNWSVVTEMSAHRMSVTRMLIVNGVYPVAISITLMPGETTTLSGPAPTFLLMGMGNTAYTEPVAFADGGNYHVRVVPLISDGHDSWINKLITGAVPLKVLAMPGNTTTVPGSKLSGQKK